jgi:hypothetical protein
MMWLLLLGEALPVCRCRAYQEVCVEIETSRFLWVRGKCEEAMREVLGAGRGVQAGEVEIPAMAAEAGRETRQGAASDEESDGCDGAQDCNTT